MKISIIAIGKLKNTSPEFQILNSYLKRIPWNINIKEISPQSIYQERMQKLEAEKILNFVGKDDILIALDENGQEYSSKEFSIFLNDRQCEHLNFCIGGAYGLDKNLLNKAHHRISLSRATWPHLLARVLLLEQIYRAYTILTNHPYHKGI